MGRCTSYDKSGSVFAMFKPRTDCCGYNVRSELIYSRRGAESAKEYAYQYDDIGNRTTYAYDRFGNLVSVTDPLGNAIVYEYDLRGRKIYEGGATYPVRYTYNIFGNQSSMTTYRDFIVDDKGQNLLIH